MTQKAEEREFNCGEEKERDSIAVPPA